MTSEKKSGPRIAFLGTGAQGASIAADFALAGLDVTFIDQWPDHVAAIRENGITVNMPTRTINAKVPALHLCQVAEIKEPFDLVFLVVKAYDTKWACELIKPVLAPNGLVIGLQNGMTHEEIAEVVGRERTIGAVIEIASNMWVPGVTNRQNDHDTSWFALGALDPATTADNVDSYTSFLEGDQLPFDWTKMSRVMHPDDWDPQNHVWPVDAAELWAASPKPDGYELPQAYADAVADGCIDKLKAEYDSHYKARIPE